MGAKIGAVFFSASPLHHFIQLLKFAILLLLSIMPKYILLLCVCERTFIHFVNHRARAIYVQAKTGGQGILVVAYLLQ